MLITPLTPPLLHLHHLGISASSTTPPPCLASPSLFASTLDKLGFQRPHSRSRRTTNCRSPDILLHFLNPRSCVRGFPPLWTAHSAETCWQTSALMQVFTLVGTLYLNWSHLFSLGPGSPLALLPHSHCLNLLHMNKIFLSRQLSYLRDVSLNVLENKNDVCIHICRPNKNSWL